MSNSPSNSCAQAVETGSVPLFASFPEASSGLIRGARLDFNANEDVTWVTDLDLRWSCEPLCTSWQRAFRVFLAC
jgi:hypothetical protein